MVNPELRDTNYQTSAQSYYPVQQYQNHQNYPPQQVYQVQQSYQYGHQSVPIEPTKPIGYSDEGVDPLLLEDPRNAVRGGPQAEWGLSAPPINLPIRPDQARIDYRGMYQHPAAQNGLTYFDRRMQNYEKSQPDGRNNSGNYYR